MNGSLLPKFNEIREGDMVGTVLKIVLASTTVLVSVEAHAQTANTSDQTSQTSQTTAASNSQDGSVAKIGGSQR
ncbi:hypothetical protein [Sphingobium yanoikuyae]|uniref:hypothetical protein n=1 Tax=Sphingobium yanoikuyae TaxID=13690 RepID=UPI00138DEA62|nr:hypothetical protein [Sphingobium yanoikuyae]